VTDEPILAEAGSGIALARLNSPDTRNALTADLMERLADLVETWDSDPEVRCIVIAGGETYFAAGADVAVMSESAEGSSFRDTSARFWPRMAACRTPLIAAVSGYALGAGFELALLCDMVVASDTAEFGQPELLLGIIPGGGATQRITRAVGRPRAMELIVTGRRIDALEAQAFGLVNRVTSKKKWLQQALDLAEVVASRPPEAVRLAKEALHAAEETGLEAGLAEERRLYELAMATEDRVEGMRAFLEKRLPDFKGR
jgi:enoyl-CoA hydratase/carnithine racemase